MKLFFFIGFANFWEKSVTQGRRYILNGNKILIRKKNRIDGLPEVTEPEGVGGLGGRTLRFQVLAGLDIQVRDNSSKFDTTGPRTSKNTPFTKS